MSESIYIKKVTAEKLKSLATAKLSMDGKELLNPTPLTVQSGAQKPPSLQEQIQRIIRNEVSVSAVEQNKESYEESLDFDVGDAFDYDDPVTQYNFMEEDHLLAIKAEQEASNETSTENIPVDNSTPPEEPSTGNTESV